MPEYRAKARRKGMQIPFGYYVSPLDPYILIPDPKKLEAIHYAYRMRAKYHTAYRDCTQWLHAATGQRMSAAGFMYAYKRWLKRLHKENRKVISAKRDAETKEKQKFIDENLKNLSLIIDDRTDITAVAEGEAYQKLQERKDSRG